MFSRWSESKQAQPAAHNLENGSDNPISSSPGAPSQGSEAVSLEVSGETTLKQSWGATQCRKLWHRIPSPITRKLRVVGGWMKGPDPPRVYRIRPVFESVQTFPIRLLSRLPKAARAFLLIAASVLWIAVFIVIISNYGLPKDIAGFGAPVRLSCISRLWPDSPSCGLDGRNCLPFDESSFAFSCPADCARVDVLNPRTIGDEQIIYRPLVVGGTPNASQADELFYRGDSFICGAAIHAGALRNEDGGCGVLSLAGEKASFGSIARNGIVSVGFDSIFPLSFNFNRDGRVSASSRKCRDPRWKLLILSVVFTVLFSLFTYTPVLFFIPVFIITYFQVALASDPPPYYDYPSAVSTAIGKFLPTAFIAALFYHLVIRKTLKSLHAQVEKTVLWLGGLWVGALSNITLDMIPIQRLTPHDLNQQPGAITALVFIVLALVAIALYQAWCFRNEGRLPRYLGLYAILGISLLIMLAVPGLDLRIHHYILGLLLLPGTSLQTRPSLLYQGLLVGLFINGIARWGFAPVLQTEAALRGDGQLGRGIPSIMDPVINASSITFTWDKLIRGYEGVSVLVNDVERFRGFHKNGDSSFTWTRLALNYPEYFRFGFVNYLPFGGVTYSDFTRAGVWYPNGTWTGIPPGIG